jgi:succinate dehydrogenase hydrophobic anchor subunit
MWAWLFQRITAVLLIVCLAIHLIFGQRLTHGSATALDIILLASAIYHALNGLRMVLMDYWFTSRKRAVALNAGLWVIGLAFLGYGIWALWPWIGY